MFPKAAPELMKMMRPPSPLPFLELSRREGRAAWTVYSREKKLTSKWARHFWVVVLGDEIFPKGSATPAFKISPSKPWKCSIPRSTAARTAGSSVLRSKVIKCAISLNKSEAYISASIESRESGCLLSRFCSSVDLVR